MNTRLGRAAASAVLLAIAIGGTALAANGAKLTAYGTRAAGRGGVDYAFADDATAPATNPAGIAFQPNRLDNNWLVADARASFRNRFGRFNMTPKLTVPLPAYSFGAVFDPTQSWHVGDLFDLGNWGLKESPKDPPYDILDQLAPRSRKLADEGTPGVPGVTKEPSDEELYGGRLRFGFGVFPVSGGSFRYRHIITPFSSPGALEYRTEALALSISPSIAYRIPGTGLAIGYAPQFIYAKFKLNGPIEQPRTTLAAPFALSSQLLNSPTVTTYATSHDLSTYGFSQRIGLLWTALESMISIGVVYQDRTYLQDYVGSADVDGNTQVGRLTFGSPALLSVIDPRINASLGFNSTYAMRIQGYQQPRMGGLGFALRPHPRVSLGLDYTFIGWEELYRVFSARLTKGSNPNLDVLTRPSVKVRVPLQYKNQHVIAVGGSFCFLQGDDIVPGVPSFQMILRAGYNWGQNPVPANTAIPQTPIFYEHHASVGFTFQWGPYLDFNLAVEHAFHNGIHTGNSITNSDLSFSHQTTQLTSYYFGMGVNF